MIEHAKKTFGAIMSQRVIKGRSEVKRHHAGGENAHADHVPGGSIARGGDDQDRGGGQSQSETDTVAEAVCDLFSDTWPAFAISGCFTHEVRILHDPIVLSNHYI